MANDLSTRCLRVGIEPQLVYDLTDNLLVLAGLLQVLLPFLFEVCTDSAPERRLVDLDAALLRLQRLVQQLGDLFVLHCNPPDRFLKLDLFVSRANVVPSGALWHRIRIPAASRCGSRG